MKILEQYIYAIGQRLPFKVREDVTKELKSNLWDDIEAKYGDNASEEQVRTVIHSFGAPRKVAKKYSGEKAVIDIGFTNLYFTFLKIMILSILVTFTVVFLSDLFGKNPEGMDLLITFVTTLLNATSVALTGIAYVTIGFILLTKFGRKNSADTEDDWSLKELEGIKIGSKQESKIANLTAIFFLTAFILIFNVFPHRLTELENLLASKGLLENRLDMDVFRYYALFISVIWAVEIVYHLMLLNAGTKTGKLRLTSFILSIAGVILLAFMILDPRMYITNTGVVGFKGGFLLVLVIGIIEVLVEVFRYVRSVQKGQMRVPS